MKRLSKGLMQNALRSQLKKKSGRKDIRIKEQPQLVYEASSAVPITDRAGLLDGIQQHSFFCV